jgi:hypothetical protein
LRTPRALLKGTVMLKAIISKGGRWPTLSPDFDEGLGHSDHIGPNEAGASSESAGTRPTIHVRRYSSSSNTSTADFDIVWQLYAAMIRCGKASTLEANRTAASMARVT